MMKKRLISQMHKKWRDIPRQHTKTVDGFDSLDGCIQACLIKPSMKNKQMARRAQASFNQALGDLIENGLESARKRNYSVEDYGCWECCLCMVAMDQNAYFYLCDQKKRLTPTPDNLIKALRSWQILSPIGYMHEIVIDPMSVVTNAHVQLVMHRDYGEQGILTTKLHTSLHQLSQRDDLSIMVCVKGHPAFGNKPNAHWVVLDAVGSDQKAQVMMRDPSRHKIIKFNYRKLYVLCVYSASTKASLKVKLP